MKFDQQIFKQLEKNETSQEIFLDGDCPVAELQRFKDSLKSNTSATCIRIGNVNTTTYTAIIEGLVGKKCLEKIIFAGNELTETHCTTLNLQLNSFKAQSLCIGFAMAKQGASLQTISRLLGEGKRPNENKICGVSLGANLHKEVVEQLVGKLSQTDEFQAFSLEFFGDLSNTFVNAVNRAYRVSDRYQLKFHGVHGRKQSCDLARYLLEQESSEIFKVAFSGGITENTAEKLAQEVVKHQEIEQLSLAGSLKNKSAIAILKTVRKTKNKIDSIGLKELTDDSSDAILNEVSWINRKTEIILSNPRVSMKKLEQLMKVISENIYINKLTLANFSENQAALLGKILEHLNLKAGFDCLEFNVGISKPALQVVKKYFADKSDPKYYIVATKETQTELGLARRQRVYTREEYDDLPNQRFSKEEMIYFDSTNQPGNAYDAFSLSFAFRVLAEQLDQHFAANKDQQRTLLKLFSTLHSNFEPQVIDDNSLDGAWQSFKAWLTFYSSHQKNIEYLLSPVFRLWHDLDLSYLHSSADGYSEDEIQESIKELREVNFHEESQSVIIAALPALVNLADVMSDDFQHADDADTVTAMLPAELLKKAGMKSRGYHEKFVDSDSSLAQQLCISVGEIFNTDSFTWLIPQQAEVFLNELQPADSEIAPEDKLKLRLAQEEEQKDPKYPLLTWRGLVNSIWDKKHLAKQATQFIYPLEYVEILYCKDRDSGNTTLPMPYWLLQQTPADKINFIEQSLFWGEIKEGERLSTGVPFAKWLRRMYFRGKAGFSVDLKTMNSWNRLSLDEQAEKLRESQIIRQTVEKWIGLDSEQQKDMFNEFNAWYGKPLKQGESRQSITEFFNADEDFVEQWLRAQYSEQQPSKVWMRILQDLDFSTKVLSEFNTMKQSWDAKDPGFRLFLELSSSDKENAMFNLDEVQEGECLAKYQVNEKFFNSFAALLNGRPWPKRGMSELKARCNQDGGFLDQDKNKFYRDLWMTQYPDFNSDESYFRQLVENFSGKDNLPFLHFYEKLLETQRIFVTGLATINVSFNYFQKEWLPTWLAVTPADMPDPEQWMETATVEQAREAMADLKAWGELYSSSDQLKDDGFFNELYKTYTQIRKTSTSKNHAALSNVNFFTFCQQEKSSLPRLFRNYEKSLFQFSARSSSPGKRTLPLPFPKAESSVELTGRDFLYEESKEEAQIKVEDEKPTTLKLSNFTEYNTITAVIDLIVKVEEIKSIELHGEWSVMAVMALAQLNNQIGVDKLTVDIRELDDHDGELAEILNKSLRNSTFKLIGPEGKLEHGASMIVTPVAERPLSSAGTNRCAMFSPPRDGSSAGGLPSYGNSSADDSSPRENSSGSSADDSSLRENSSGSSVDDLSPRENSSGSSADDSSFRENSSNLSFLNSFDGEVSEESALSFPAGSFTRLRASS